MNNIIKSPLGMGFFPHLWNVDTFNPQKSVYSITLGLRHDLYQKYIKSIQDFIGANNVNEDNESYVSFNGIKYYRKLPDHPSNSSGLFLCKAQMKSELDLDNGVKKKQKPFIVNKKGEDIPQETDLAGCLLMVHSKPTVFKRLSVISNILKGVVVYNLKKPEIEQCVIQSVKQSSLVDGREHSVI